MPRLIGFSVGDLRRFGHPNFYDGKEWAAAWRFVFRRSTVMAGGVRFPVGVTMSEDRYFNIEFLCHARQLRIMEEPLYIYYQNPQSLISRLDDPLKTLRDKECGIEQRTRLRRVYLEKQGFDIFDLYAGTLVLSCFELYTKLCHIGLRRGWRLLRRYQKREEIREAFRRTALRPLPLKIMLPVALYKCRLGFVMFAGLWLLNKIKR